MMISKLLLILFLFHSTFALYTNSSGITTSEIVVTSTLYGTVTELTTYCPLSTEIVTNGETYSVTAATTLTITNCPCVHLSTITYTETVLCSSGTTFSTLSFSTTFTPEFPTTPATTPATTSLTTPTSTISPTSEASSSPSIATAEGKGDMLKAPGVVAGVAILLAYVI